MIIYTILRTLARPFYLSRRSRFWERNSNTPCLAELEVRARAGRPEDVDYLMNRLHRDAPLVLCKMVDYSLGLVVSAAGEERIRHHLFFGRTQMQRNYAALYFKRRSAMILLFEAVQRGCIDEIQAFSR